MKKTIFSVLLLLSVVMICVTSCNKDEATCWVVFIVETSPDDVPQSSTKYVWGTESYVDAKVEQYKAEAARLGHTCTIVLDSNQTYGSAAECEANNKK